MRQPRPPSVAFRGREASYQPGHSQVDNEPFERYLSSNLREERERL